MSSPLVRFSLESLEFSLELYMQQNESKMKFCILHLDNAIELILKEKLRSLGISIYERGRTVDFNKAISMLEENGIKIKEKADLEMMRDDRNLLQHKGGHITIDQTKFYIETTFNFMERFLNDELNILLKSSIPERYYNLLSSEKSNALTESQQTLIEELDPEEIEEFEEVGEFEELEPELIEESEEMEPEEMEPEEMEPEEMEPEEMEPEEMEPELVKMEKTNKMVKSKYTQRTKSVSPTTLKPIRKLKKIGKQKRKTGKEKSQIKIVKAMKHDSKLLHLFSQLFSFYTYRSVDNLLERIALKYGLIKHDSTGLEAIQYLVKKKKLSLKDLKNYEKFYDFRNKLVHGEYSPTIKESNDIASSINRLIEKLLTQLNKIQELERHNNRIVISKNLKSKFSPSNLKIHLDQVVVWENQDKEGHVIASGRPASGSDGVFNSGLISSTNSFEYLYKEDGIHHYFCLVHPWETGIITVE